MTALIGKYSKGTVITSAVLAAMSITVSGGQDVVVSNNGLCGTSGASSSSNSPNMIQPAGCIVIGGEGGSQTFGPEEWGSCCSFTGDEDGGACRSFATTGAYCVDGHGDGHGGSGAQIGSKESCKSMNKGDSISLSVEFHPMDPDTTCCKSCTCFGDPECVSFNGKRDLWIPCDARTTTSCTITKATCEQLKDPSWTSDNPVMCKWIRNNSATNQDGWLMQMNGSPCVPDLSGSPVAMNMYRSKNGVSIDLHLGERGIISDALFTLPGESRKEPFVLNAEECFAGVGAQGWQGGRAPPGATSRRSGDNREVSWSFLNKKSQTFVKLLCVRALEKGHAGPPRINIQEVTVPAMGSAGAAAAGGSGFCATGTIEGRTGDYEESAIKHGQCIQDQPDALQACKHLVNFALTIRDLNECALQYCALAALDQDWCNNYLAGLGGANDGRWMRAYCTAVHNNGELPPQVPISECIDIVQGEGYAYATDQWGNGAKRADQVATDDGKTQCGDSIKAYELMHKPSCTDGLSVDIDRDGNGTWVEALFIPVNLPPCGGTLNITARDSPTALLLFTRPWRIRQCDVKQDVLCEGSSRCSMTSGITWSLTYTNERSKELSNLVNLYDDGLLRCTDKEMPDGSVDNTWCFEGDNGFNPSDLCPCPDPKRLLLRA